MNSLALLCGSLRADSQNAAVARLLGRVAVDELEITAVHTVDHSALPYFNEDLEAGEYPQEVARVRDAVTSADGLVVFSPNYNGGPPGGLKNTLDWLSRPYRRGPLMDKVGAVITASSGKGDALPVRAALAHVLRCCGVELVAWPALDLTDVRSLRASSGELTCAQTAVAIRGLLIAMRTTFTAAGRRANRSGVLQR